MIFFSPKAQKWYKHPCKDTSLLQLVISVSNDVKVDHSTPAERTIVASQRFSTHLLSPASVVIKRDYKDRFPLLIAVFHPITNSPLYFPLLPFMLFLASFLSFPFPHPSFYLVPSGLYFLHLFFFFFNLCRGIQH